MRTGPRADSEKRGPQPKISQRPRQQVLGRHYRWRLEVGVRLGGRWLWVEDGEVVGEDLGLRGGFL